MTTKFPEFIGEVTHRTRDLVSQMCRLVAYQGEPILLEALVLLPSHSLVRQSTHARQAITPMNVDGFGLGWYGHSRQLETYHSEKPAWADRNLPSICERVRSGSFFAHVRAATDTEVTQANCHPFANGRLLFMHNGQVGGWPAIRQCVEAALPSRVKLLQRGTTDSEAIFLSAIADGLESDAISSIKRTLARLLALRSAVFALGPLRFAAVLSDGDTLWAFRWSCDARPPTLFYRQRRGGVTVASEPIDQGYPDWDEVPSGTCLIARRGEPIRIVPFVVPRPSDIYVRHARERKIAGIRSIHKSKRAIASC